MSSLSFRHFLLLVTLSHRSQNTLTPLHSVRHAYRRSTKKLWHAPCFIEVQRRRTSQHTLRITVEENSLAVTLKLEGRLAGPWTTELERLWQETASLINSRQLFLDLRETTYADATGIRALRSIYSQTEAAILAGSPWTQYLADEVKRQDTAPSREA